MLHHNETNVKLVKIKPLPQYLYTKFCNQEVVVSKNTVFTDATQTEIIGTCNISDGVYHLNTIRNLTYISYETNTQFEEASQVKHCTVIINDGAKEIIEKNNKVLCQTVTRDGKIFTSLIVDNTEIGSLVNYGFDPELHNKTYYYRIVSNTTKRYVFELRSDEIIENVVEIIKPTCFLTGKLENYTEDRLKQLVDYTILCEANVIDHPFFQVLQNTGNEFRVCKNQDEMIMQAEYFIGKNESLLKTLAEKTKKNFLLV
jgi:hypothetical protein